MSGVIAVAGATGYIGGLLCQRLATTAGGARAGPPTRARPAISSEAGCEVVRADVLEPATLGEALEGVGVAYYLVHSMGRGADGTSPSATARAPRTSPPPRPPPESSASSTSAGSARAPSTSTAATRPPRCCASGEVPVTYFRAAAVIGAGSESFRTVFYLVSACR